MKHYAILLCTMLAACGGSQTPAPGVVNPSPVVSQPTAPPVITQTPPPVVQTDDTATLQALLDKGDLEQLEGRTYHTTHALIATRSGATLRGQAGTVIEFQSPPVGTLRDPGVNDRVFGIGGSVSTTTQLPIAKAISVGDTSFEAFYAADVANIVPGDWVIITVNDPGIADENTHLGYPTYVDWEQVTAVDGTTVHVATPFRMAFTNTLAFVTNSSGLGFVRVNLTQNVTLEDLTIQVDPGAPVVGVYVLGTLNTTLSNVTIIDASSDQLYTEESKGLTVTGCNFVGGKVLNELSESVDLTISNSKFASANAVPIALDLGTGFFAIKDNTITQSFHIAIYAFYNVHDGVISGNVIDPITGASDTYGMLLLGSPNVMMDNNTISGSNGAGGILAEGFAGASLSETSAGDTAAGNTITGFTTAVSIH